MAIELVPDAETMTVSFLLNDSDVAALVGTNVATQLPANPPFPFVLAQHISTSPVGGEANVNEFWVQIDVYAGKKNFASASSVARTIQAVCFGVKDRAVTTSTESFLIYGARVRNFRRVPEPATEWARFSIDVLFTARSS